MTTKNASDGAKDGAASASMLGETLERLRGKRVVIVMGDERSFKGTVDEFDDNWLWLTDTAEGSTVNSRGWEEVVLNTGVIGKRFTDHGVFTEQGVGKLVRLKDVLINLDDIRRVWPWEPSNMAKPKHVEVETKKTVF